LHLTLLSSSFPNRPLLTRQCYSFRINLRHHQAH
jgi:hypothetical protein